MDILKILLIITVVLLPVAELGKAQLGPVSFTLNDIFLSLTFAAWIIKNHGFKTFLENKTLKKPVLLFTLVALISLAVNLNWLGANGLFVSMLYLARWLLYASLYFILLSLDRKFIKKFMFILLIPISTFLLFGFIQYGFYQNLRNLYYLGWDEHLYRLFSTFLDPNFAGTFFVISFVFILALALKFIKENKSFGFIFTLVLTAINLVAIYLTYSRSALIMLFVSVSVFLILIKKKKILFILYVIFLILIFASPRAFKTEGTNLLRIASVEARLDSARVAIDIFNKNLVLGVGYNSYRFAQHKYGYLVGDKWETTHSGAGTDNSFLFLLATTGIIGLSSYLYLIYKVANQGHKKKNIFSAVLIASLAGVLVNSIFINSLFYVYIMEWLWILAAITENS